MGRGTRTRSSAPPVHPERLEQSVCVYARAREGHPRVGVAEATRAVAIWNEDCVFLVCDDHVIQETLYHGWKDQGKQGLSWDMNEPGGEREEGV